MKHHFRHRRHSLSTRLVWIFLTIAVIFVVLVGGTMGLAFKHGFEDNLRPHLVRYLEYVQADIGAPPDITKAKVLVERLPIEIHIFKPDETWSSTGQPPDLTFIDYKHGFEQNGTWYQMGEYQGREYLVTKNNTYTLAFSIPRTRGPIYWRLGIPMVILLLVLMLLHHATRKLFRPIETLKAGVKRIGQGELDYRVDINRRDELGELATNINAMADDIQQMLEAKRQLLLAISHELRSPITRAKVSLEMLEDADQRAELNRELNDMEQLIEELLETERLSTRHRVLNKTDVSLNQLIRSLIEESFEDASIDLQLPKEDLVANVDAIRIKLLLKNLIENAIHHNANDAQLPQVTLEKRESAICFTVRDYGKGIEEQHLPYLTEPFYRVDPARQRQTGGFGLGLYLCRMIAEAHGGTLEVANAQGGGTEVKVQLNIDSL
jgi:signal transduction histidine kinase